MILPSLHVRLKGATPCRAACVFKELKERVCRGDISSNYYMKVHESVLNATLSMSKLPCGGLAACVSPNLGVVISL